MGSHRSPIFDFEIGTADSGPVKHKISFERFTELTGIDSPEPQSLAVFTTYFEGRTRELYLYSVDYAARVVEVIVTEPKNID